MKEGIASFALKAELLNFRIFATAETAFSVASRPSSVYKMTSIKLHITRNLSVSSESSTRRCSGYTCHFSALIDSPRERSAC